MDKYTIRGIIALLLWGSSPIAILNLKKMHPLLVLCFCALVGLVITLARLKISSEKSIKSALKNFNIRECMALFGCQFLYILSFKKGPPELVELVTYVWPVLSFFVLAINKQVERAANIIIAIFIAFGGLFLLLYPSICQGEIYFDCIALSLLGACCWIIFMLESRRYKTPPEVVGFYMGFNAIIAATILLLKGGFVFPSINELVALTYLGISGYSLAFYLWTEAIQKGRMDVLLVFSYFNPLLSILMLVITFHASMSYRLLISSLAVCLAGYLTATPQKDKKEVLCLS